jgi:hypothetical protein
MSEKRFNGTMLQNLHMFSRVWGCGAMPKTALITTNWPLGPDNVLDRREEEMRAEHWKNLIDKGLRVCRFQLDYSSAWDVINSLLNHTNDVDLPILSFVAEESKLLCFVREEIPDPEICPNFTRII